MIGVWFGMCVSKSSVRMVGTYGSNKFDRSKNEVSLVSEVLFPPGFDPLFGRIYFKAFALRAFTIKGH